LRLLRFLFLTSMFKERNFPFSGCKGTKEIELVKFSSNFFFSAVTPFHNAVPFFEERPHRLGGQMYNRFSNLKILFGEFFQRSFEERSFSFALAFLNGAANVDRILTESIGNSQKSAMYPDNQLEKFAQGLPKATGKVCPPKKRPPCSRNHATHSAISAALNGA
jgi:hypothetical protein